MEPLQEMKWGYLACAVWASTDDDGYPVDHLDLSEVARDELESDCVDFWEGLPVAIIAAYSALVSAGVSTWARFGHDYWLTRNGHGAGFWDRGHGALGDWLTEACEYNERYLYVADSGDLEVL